jgi:hypothetical protein
VLLSDASPLARVAVALSVAGFGIGTTAALHWFTSPYVHELQRAAAAAPAAAGGAAEPAQTSSGGGEGGRLRAKTLSLFGRPRWAEFGVAEVEHPDSMRPLATFKVQAGEGRGRERRATAARGAERRGGGAQAAVGGLTRPDLPTPRPHAKRTRPQPPLRDPPSSRRGGGFTMWTAARSTPTPSCSRGSRLHTPRRRSWSVSRQRGGRRSALSGTRAAAAAVAVAWAAAAAAAPMGRAPQAAAATTRPGRGRA